jgi:hypothetical protein
VSGYVLGRDAEADLHQIWDYIAQDSINAAEIGSKNSLNRLRHLVEIRAWVMRARI